MHQCMLPSKRTQHAAAVSEVANDKPASATSSSAATSATSSSHNSHDACRAAEVGV